MNKTRKRAIQKHRAKAMIYTLRRKAEAEQHSVGGKGKATATAAVATTTRTKSSSKRRADAVEGAESSSDNA